MSKTQEKKRRTIKIPMDLRANFLRDPENFMRDIACIPLEAVRPYFQRRDKIMDAIKIARPNPFDEVRMTFDPEFKSKDDYNRYLHIDLGLTGDACGISMAHCPYFIQKDVYIEEIGGGYYKKESVPFVQFDFIGRIKAPRNQQIQFSEIREIIYNLTSRGFYISLITYDGFQSVDSIQILSSKGYNVSRLSIDRTSHKILADKSNKSGNWKEKENIKRESTGGLYTSAMDSFKQAMYEDRLSLVEHPYTESETKGAQIDYAKNKVDHKPRGTIDVLQSLAGSTFNLVNNEKEVNLQNLQPLDTQERDEFYRGYETDSSDYLYGE